MPPRRPAQARYHQPVKIGGRSWCPVCNQQMWIDRPDHQLCPAIITDFTRPTLAAGYTSR